MADIAIETQDPQARSEALFRMRTAGENGDDKSFGLRPDGRAPSPEAFRRPFGVSSVRTGHMRWVCSVTRATISALMHSDTFAAMEDLDHPRGRPDIDLAPDEAVRDGIEEALEFDVVIRRHPCQTPFRELVVLGGQTSECCLFDRLKEVPTTDAQPAHDVIVDALQHLGDRGIGLREREEGQFAKTAENTALGELYAILHLGLVLWASRTCW